ncbi:unnamed protein product, partial [Rotaria magnacalcarata]
MPKNNFNSQRFTNEKEEQPDQISQQGLSAGDSWSSAT